MNSDEVEQLQELLKIHKKRVNVLEQQAAKYGINCPPEIKIEIEDIRQQIARFERNLQGNVIQSYVQGRETLKRFNREMDDVTHGLSNVVVEEKRTYRFFGLPVWSVVISRTILTLLMMVAGFGAGLALEQQNRTAGSPQATAQAAQVQATALAQIVAEAQLQRATAQASQATARAQATALVNALAQQGTALAEAARANAEAQAQATAFAQTLLAQTTTPEPTPPDTPTITP